jgi:hypothetical protein
MTKGTVADNRSGIRSWPIGAAGFLLMVGVGSMYGMSALQVELPRLLGLTPEWSLAPFGAASLGLAAGTAVAARVLRGSGPRKTAVVGAAVWGAGITMSGLALANGSLAGMLAGFAVGGIGVGLAYLTIVATVGPSFPAQPLIGSAIGPLGFMAGTSLFFVTAIITGFHQQDSGAIGAVLVTTGLVIIVLSLLAGRGLPATQAGNPGTGEPARSSAAPAKRLFSLLLFANALPGMLLLAIVVPVMASYNGKTDITSVEGIIAATTVALFLGGLLAPGIRRRLGARKTFAVLLLGRSLLLLTLPFVSGTATGIVLLGAVLFGHGAGFSLLPALMKSQDNPSRFPVNYGQVLIAWGVAGVGGAAAAALSVSVTGGYNLALFLAGGVVLIAALFLLIRGANLPAFADDYKLFA